MAQQHEFLPLCDVLFNIISLASYFCDIVFDVAMSYALAHHPTAPPGMFLLSIAFVLASLFISQLVSIRWYLWGARGKLQKKNVEQDCTSGKKGCSWTMGCVLFFHSTQIGVFWRYFKLFIPVDLTYVKHEVRELCVLRLIHAFCEAAPMLLLQLYLLSSGIERDVAPGETTSLGVEDAKLKELTTISAGLSLWNVCWAVASFSKGAARLRNIERLVLTWLGVLAQLAWRLGTVSARVGALITYASLYGGQWMLVVVTLHWLSMLTWLLLTPDGLFHGDERLPLPRKCFLASLLAFVYVFAYINLHETNHRQKMLIFYSVMFLENSLLIGVWAVGVNGNELHSANNTRPATTIFTLLSLFCGGLFFMGLYYRFFHVRRLRYEAGGRMNGTNATSLPRRDPNGDKQLSYLNDKKMSADAGIRKAKLSNGGIPGVFNCRFANPTVGNLNRKKKKPTTFVPPPAQHQNNCLPTSMGESKLWLNGSANSKQLIPFWKRPLPTTVFVQDNEIDAKNQVDLNGSLMNVNLIHEKLREKKQQQLRELRAIQEEIKEGKLVPPPSTSSFPSTQNASNQRPPPNTKLHTTPNSPTSHVPQNGAYPSWPPVKMHCLLPPAPASSFPWKSRDRVDTQEILLAPRCLPHHYMHWNPPPHASNSHRLRSSDNEEEETAKVEKEGGGSEAELSDMEGSQVSLPRSYTLPREFKFSASRSRRASKLQPSRFYLPSNNSSDGDVDSADNDEETDSELRSPRMESPTARRKRNSRDSSSSCFSATLYGASRPSQLLRKVKHETKL